MSFVLDFEYEKMDPPIMHHHRMMLIGSCFTEHMSAYLRRFKFQVCENPHGIVYNPISIAESLRDVISCKEYTQHDLFLWNEYWSSWSHHSDFSFRDKNKTLSLINTTIKEQHEFLKTCDIVFLTLGSAYAYWLKKEQRFVSNNHRVPADRFEKILLDVDTISANLQSVLDELKHEYPSIRVVITISPVRHIRDGIIENNRSKARLIEAVHRLKDVYYFPAYELIIDVLRDYRFYDADMVHPNYQATQYVWNEFKEHCISPDVYPLLTQLDQLYKAFHHKPKDTESEAHKLFLQQHLELTLSLKSSYNYIDLSEETSYFSNNYIS
jgi:GSCFA family.